MNKPAKLPATGPELLDAFEITLRALAQLTCERFHDNAALARFKHTLERQTEQSARARPLQFDVTAWALQFGQYVDDAYTARNSRN